MDTTGRPAAVDGDVRNLAAVVVGVVALSLPTFLVGTMAVQIRESLHFSAAALGVAVGASNLGGAVSSLPASRLTERVGGVRIMRLATLGGAVALVLLGTEARSWGDLTALLLVAGALSGAMNPAANLFLARRSPERRQGLAFGLKQAAVPFASLLGGLAVPAVALQLGWRWTFRLSAVLAVLAALLVPKARLSLAERRQRHPAPPGDQVGRRPLIVLAVGLGLGVMVGTGVATFLVSSAVGLGYSKGAAGLVAAVAGAAAVVVRVLSGVRADRRDRAHFRTVMAMLMVGAGGCALLAVGEVSPSKVALVVGAVVALGAGWGWNGLFIFAVVRSHPVAPAAATGITQVGGRLGGVLGPVLFGVVVNDGSYADAWLLGAVIALVAALAISLGHHLLARQLRAAPAGATVATPDGRTGGRPDG